jgi:hypothetical protein
VYHFIYDATGLISSNILIGILGYYPKLTEIILNILNKYIEKTDPIITYLFTHNILGFIEKLKEFK